MVLRHEKGEKGKVAKGDAAAAALLMETRGCLCGLEFLVRVCFCACLLAAG